MNRFYKLIILIVLNGFFTITVSAQDLKLIFNEQFRDNSNKWQTVDNDDLFESIEKNKYYIHTLNPQFANRAEIKIELLESENFKIESKITKLDGEESKFYGLTWGANYDNYYAFLISESGLFVVLEHSNGQNKYIQKWQRFAANKAKAKNTLKVERIENELLFYINDTKVSSTAYKRFFGKRIGFFSSPTLLLEIDHLKIYQENYGKEEVIAKVETAKETPKGPKLIVFKQPEVIKHNDVTPIEVTLLPEFPDTLYALPNNLSYFNNYDFKRVKDKSKDDAHYITILGDFYRTGYQLKEPNYKRALKYYEKAVEEGDSVAFSRLAYHKFAQNAHEPNPDEFLKKLTESANRGFPEAQFDLALIYLHGMYEYQKDWAKAKQWFEIYANGDTSIVDQRLAFRILGRMHYHQEAKQSGINPNFTLATAYLRKSNAIQELDSINVLLANYGNLRFLLNKYPEYFSDIDVSIDYTDYKSVRDLLISIENNSSAFLPENLTNYSNSLKENLLYENYQKVKTDKQQLTVFIESVRQMHWLKPYNLNYVDYAFHQIPVLLNYDDINDVRIYHDFMLKHSQNELAKDMRKMIVQTYLNKGKESLASILDIMEILHRQDWIREEMKEYMPVISDVFDEIAIKSKYADLKLKDELFKPKGEFETTTDYEKRQQEAMEYKTIIENKYNEYKDKFRIQRIKFSHEIVDLSLEGIGIYNADAELMPITIKGKTEKVKIPINEAPSFKENQDKVEVNAEKQLKEDAKTYEIFNIKIRHPLTGSVYYFGEQKDPLYMDYITEDDGQGIPKLEASVEFIEPSGNNILDAREQAFIKVLIKNTGTGFARNINLTMLAENKTVIKYDRFKTINGIAPETEFVQNLELDGPKNLPTGEVDFNLNFTESKGFPPAPINIKIPTQEFKEPQLVFLEAGIKENGNGNNIIENSEIIDVTALIQNRGQGKAIETRAIVNFRDKNIINLTPEQTNQNLGTIEPGEAVKINFSFVVNNNYKGDDMLPIYITLKEADNLYGGVFPLGLQMKQVSMVANSIKVDGHYSSDKKIEDVSLTSEVDKNIPESDTIFPDRYALVFGNEDYTKYQKGLSTESNVDFARTDALTFAKYAKNVLGVPEDNLFVKTDAISSEMETEIEKLSKIAQYNTNAEIFFYYAGHGFPDENSKESYLMPVDISGANVSNGIKLASLYKTLTNHNPKRVTVFLDACFSGGGRNQGLLAARAIKIKPKDEAIKGNIVIYSASSGQQSALPYKDKKHGMFTFFLLKKLQDTKGDLTYRELYDYIKKEVQLNSVVKNGKDQNPEVNFSRTVMDEWENWTFK